MVSMRHSHWQQRKSTIWTSGIYYTCLYLSMRIVQSAKLPENLIKVMLCKGLRGLLRMSAFELWLKM